MYRSESINFTSVEALWNHTLLQNCKLGQMASFALFFFFLKIFTPKPSRFLPTFIRWPAVNQGSDSEAFRASRLEREGELWQTHRWRDPINSHTIALLFSHRCPCSPPVFQWCVDNCVFVPKQMGCCCRPPECSHKNPWPRSLMV